MRVELHGGGLPTRSEAPGRRFSNDVMSLGAYRVGGLGDGLVGLAQVLAARRAFSPRSVVAFGDQTTIRTLRYGTPEVAVQRLGGSYFMRNELLVRDQMAGGYDLWLDLKPVPIVRGRKASLAVRDEALIAKLEDLDREYFSFQGDRIRDLYRDQGCIGQLDMIEAAYGMKGSMEEVTIPTRRPNEDSIDIPSRKITISGGFGPTSIYKAWPAERWTEVCHFFTKRGECPIQVGRPDELHIEGSLSATHLPLEEQLWLMADADVHVGSDGFMCHAATALGVPTVVLWGPTPYEVWGHPQQIHVLTPATDNVWWTHLHWAWDDRCGDMMREIQTDRVLAAIERGLERER